MDIVLTHFICMRWIRNLSTSILAFDISQFFLSLNHQLLTLILGKVDLDSRVVKFFLNYLVGRRTQYFWNNFSSLFWSGSRISLISYSFSYISSIFSSYFRKTLKNLKNSHFYFILCRQWSSCCSKQIFF